MIILLFVIFIILGELSEKYRQEGLAYLFAGGVILCFVIGFALICIFPYNIEPKIALYTEENAKIEEKIKATVQLYMEHEKETYTNLVKDADLTTLLIAYPELNSNELVKAEIDTYIKNSKEIKWLKERQIDKNLMAWWLYFGLGD